MIMEVPMLMEALAWFVIFFVTAIVKYVTEKTKNKIKAEWVVAFLALVAGWVYYLINQHSPEIVEQLTAFIVGMFGVSQIIYLYIFKKIK